MEQNSLLRTSHGFKHGRMRRLLGILLVMLLFPVRGSGTEFNTTEELQLAARDAFASYLKGEEEPTVELYDWDAHLSEAMGDELAHTLLLSWIALEAEGERSGKGYYFQYIDFKGVDKMIEEFTEKKLKEYFRAQKNHILEAKELSLAKAKPTGLLVLRCHAYISAHPVGKMPTGKYVLIRALEVP
jgi:hypothetical protein